MVVHVSTFVETVFGELDAEGNVFNKRPVRLEVPKLDKALFEAAYDHLAKAKADADAAAKEAEKGLSNGL